MPVVFLITIAAVLVGIFYAAIGRGGELAYEHADHAPLDMGPVSAADVALLRPPTALWGYNMQVTDEALDQIARAMRERDITIAYLQDQLASVEPHGSYAEPRGAHARQAEDGAPAPGVAPFPPAPGLSEPPGDPASQETLEAPRPAGTPDVPPPAGTLDDLLNADTHEDPPPPGTLETPEPPETLEAAPPADVPPPPAPPRTPLVLKASPAKAPPAAETPETPETPEAPEAPEASDSHETTQPNEILDESHETTQPNEVLDESHETTLPNEIPDPAPPAQAPAPDEAQGPQGAFNTHDWWAEQRQAARDDDGHGDDPMGAAEEQGW